MRFSVLIATLVLLSPVVPRNVEPIDRVEEDWELVVEHPDVPAAGPQITTTMRPSSEVACPVVNFNLNYRDRPSFQPGGLQVQVWDGDLNAGLATDQTALLQTVDETISWTQRMTISAGTIEYEIRAGHSTTWGHFGGDALKVTFATGVSDLSGYRAETSLRKSGIGWQSDHVTSMKLMKVRYYSGETLVATEETPRSIGGNESP